jgi:hypothetical protein
MAGVYVASMVRTVISLHNLINNKVANKEHEVRQAPPVMLCYVN